MPKPLLRLLVCLLTVLPFSSYALLSMELTRGVAGAIPVAVVPFANDSTLPSQTFSSVVASDLQNSGRFKVTTGDKLKEKPTSQSAVSLTYFRQLGTNSVVLGTITPKGADRYVVNFQLVDIYQDDKNAKLLLQKEYNVNKNELRAVAHHISDLVYRQLTGVRGVFSTKIAYIVVERPQNAPARYILVVADQDGYNAKPLLTSKEPIMSPAWSPNGKQIAYVSFEKHKSSIYLQNVITGSRQLLSEFPGINGAPAWSPDGKQLALALSKSGSLNIYIMDIGSRKLTAITNDFNINTEPAFSPDGKLLVFTSNRSGNPQIYQVKMAAGRMSGGASRVSYDGDYNARPSFTNDGKKLAMIHRVDNVYYIAVLNLDTGATTVLNRSNGDSASPSIAPNGSMVLYDTLASGRTMLGMSSTDGRIQLLLPVRSGDAQDPAWSPFLS